MVVVGLVVAGFVVVGLVVVGFVVDVGAAVVVKGAVVGFSPATVNAI